MTIVVANRAECERPEARFEGPPPGGEPGLDCARHEAFGREAMRGGHAGAFRHHSGERHLPDLQICGPNDGPANPGQPQGQPQEAPCPPSPQQAQTEGQEIAQIAKTVAQLVKGFEQMFGGGQGAGAGGAGGAGSDGAAHRVAQNHQVQAEGDQAASPAQKSQAAGTDNSLAPIVTTAAKLFAGNQTGDAGSTGPSSTADTWGNDGTPAPSLATATPDTSSDV